MADEQGKPAAGELVAVAPKARANGNDGWIKCAACGLAHGSVGVHIACLDREITRLRNFIARQRVDRWCERCGTQQATARMREPDDDTVSFGRPGQRASVLTRASVLCDPCAFALVTTQGAP